MAIYPRETSGLGDAPAAAPAAAGLGPAGMALQLAGAVTGAIGSFYETKSRQYQLKSQALDAEYAASLSTLNAQAAESEASAIMAAGNQEIGMTAMRYAQTQASLRASTGASGVAIGEGSAAEVDATVEFSKQVDMLTMSVSRTRAANAARAEAVNFRNTAALQRVSAQNLRRSAKTMNPYISAMTSLTGSVAQGAPDWVVDQRALDYTRRRR